MLPPQHTWILGMGSAEDFEAFWWGWILSQWLASSKYSWACFESSRNDHLTGLRQTDTSCIVLKHIYISPRFRLVGWPGAKELHNTEKIFETFCFWFEITSLEGHFEIISQIPCYREPKKIYILSIYEGRQRLASKDNSVSKTMKIFLQHQTVNANMNANMIL